MSLDDDVVERGQELTVSGQVDPGVQPVSRAATDGTIVNVYFDGDEVGIATVDSDGRYSLDFIVPDVSVGYYVVSIDYLGVQPTAQVQVAFRNCDEARAAGYQNIPEGDPAYADHLDEGGIPGVACETDDVTPGGTYDPSSYSPNTASTPLARTGTSTVPMMAAGFGLVGFGAVLTHRSRRRPA